MRFGNDEKHAILSGVSSNERIKFDLEINLAHCSVIKVYHGKGNGYKKYGKQVGTRTSKILGTKSDFRNQLE